MPPTPTTTNSTPPGSTRCSRATGLAWDDLAADAVRFRIGDTEVRVGRLEKLLRSKELAGRAKDVEFLRMWAARLRDVAGET